MRTLAIIPARGGSKRIPRKNIRSFMGKPMLSYAIKAAKKSEIFNIIMVSTDDDEIAIIADDYGVETPYKRSEKNASDFATTAEVIEEVLENYKEDGYEFDFVCCIYPCVPLLDYRILQKAHQKLEEEDWDCLFPVLKYSHPIQRSLKLENNSLVWTYPEFQNTRSQDLSDNFHDAGQFYFFKVKEFLEHKKILLPKTSGILISELDAQDIDTELDWKLAELKFSLKNS